MRKNEQHSIKVNGPKTKNSDREKLIEMYLIGKMKYEFSFWAITQNCKSNTLKNAY